MGAFAASLCSTEGFLKDKTHPGGLRILIVVPFGSSGLWVILSLSGPPFLISTKANDGQMKIHEPLCYTLGT